MAYGNEALVGGAPADGRPVASAANWLGAAVSIALVAGVGVWGYKLLVRDVSGIPVVKASAEPMRIAPTDPGGRPADHMGYSVNSVAGTGLAEAPADTLRLAPPPTGLAEEDVPLGSVRANARPFVEPTVAEPQAFSLASVPATSDEIAPLAVTPARRTSPQEAAEQALAEGLSENDAIQALADQIAAGIAPLAEQDLSDTPAVETILTGADTAAAPNPLADLPGVARSPRPSLRPRGLRTASFAPLAPTQVSATATDVALDAAPATASLAAGEVAAAEVPAGTRLVQLGAFESPEVARAEWARLTSRFSDYLGDKSRIVQKANSGGRTFYRLRAMGFEDIADARRFCAAFVAAKADCIPLVTR